MLRNCNSSNDEGVMAIELYSVNEVGEDVYLEFMVDRKTANQILSGFLLRAITDAVKDIDPERPKPPKEGGGK